MRFWFIIVILIAGEIWQEWVKKPSFSEVRILARRHFHAIVGIQQSKISPNRNCGLNSIGLRYLLHKIVVVAFGRERSEIVEFLVRRISRERSRS